MITTDERRLKSAKPVDEEFVSLRTDMDRALNACRGLSVTSESQTAEMRIARENRLALRGIRLAVTKLHKELKEESLEYCKKLDTAKREVLSKIEPEEARLLELETFAERARMTRELELTGARRAELAALGTPGVGQMALGQMTDAEYQELLADAIGMKAARDEQIKRMLEEMESQKRAEEAERARLKQEAEASRVEAEKLRAEAAEAKAALSAEREKIERAQRAIEAEKAIEPPLVFSAGNVLATEVERAANDAKKLADFAERAMAIPTPNCHGKMAREVIVLFITKRSEAVREIRAEAERLNSGILY